MHLIVFFKSITLRNGLILIGVLFTQFWYGVQVYAQTPQQWNSSEIHHALNKFNSFGNVLYVGAHPDDENTRLITYFANHERTHTGYLSLTRGGGGQNLIGPELKTTLGIIRSHELQQARSIDGGLQRFTRAIDFGYCKYPDEALDTWGHEEILRDVVRNFRRFRPDVIINRFNHRTPGSTHGHHTASAILSVEAFDKASDPSYDPESVQEYGTWQPKRLFFNTSWWFYGSQEAFDAADKSNILEVPVGKYYASLGQSNGEIAAQSRSMHKSQGFGSLSSRAKTTEYLELIRGDLPKEKSDPLEGIKRGWERMGLSNTHLIVTTLDKVIDNFDFRHPQTHALALLMVLEELKKQPKSPQLNAKIYDLTQIIVQCLGLYVSAESSAPFVTAKDKLTARVEITNRSQESLKLHRIQSNQLYFFDYTQPMEIKALESKTIESLEAPLKAPELTTPYWLKYPPNSGRFKVQNNKLIGRPFGPELVNVTLDFSLQNYDFSVTTPLRYKYRDRVQGEVFDPFVVLPEITLSMSQPVMIFNDRQAKKIDITLSAHRNAQNGSLSIQHPEGWRIEPKFIDFNIAKAGEQVNFSFDVFPPKEQQTGYIEPLVQVGDQFYSKSLTEVIYPHIPKITALERAQTKVIKMEVSRSTQRIGYIQGAGDQVDKGLEQLGYDLVSLNPKQLNSAQLNTLDAVVLGIRTFNTSEDLVARMNIINQYVAQGGLLLIQYQTTSGLLTTQMGPLPFVLGRDRVTDQTAPMVFLDPEHPIFNQPNPLSKVDFEYWVQERGLYFAKEWGNEFTPLMGMNDPGEPQRQGGLILGHYGQGTVIYTGISFFRQLPEGVPGAYKLLANLLSYNRE